MADLSLLTVVPYATLFLMVISFVLTTVNQVLSRALISHFLGWDNYHSMRKELNAFRKESMDAARSNDKKRLENVKKRQPQINAINTKMMKPNMINMGISMAMFMVIWQLFLIPLFRDAGYYPSDGTFWGGMLGGNTVAFLPGYGIPLFILYSMYALFFSTIMQRVLGAMPIE